MATEQSYNKRINAWVKYKIVKKKNGGRYIKVLNVKQIKPSQKFKGVKVSKSSSRK